MCMHRGCLSGAVVLALAGAAAAQPGAGVGYVEFDGIDDLITTPGDFVYPELTVEAWVRPTSLHPLYTAGVVTHGSRGVSSFDLGIGQQTDTRLRFFINYNQGQKTIVGNEPIALHEWQHIAVTYDGQTARLYINGELDAEKLLGAAILPSGPDALLAIGDDYPGASEFVGGSFDEVRVWSVVRRESEIAGAMFTPLSGDEPGLEAYYSFDECGSQVAVDRGPRGRHGRLGLSYSAGDDDPERFAYGPSRRRCLALSSSDFGEVRPVVGLIDEQLAQINAGPPALGWTDIANRHTDLHVRDAFECGEHLDRSFVDSESYLAGADEVTLDNCGSAFYRVRFTMPPVVRGAAVYGVANADDLGLAFVNSRPVSLQPTTDDVANLGADRSFQGHSLLGWPSADAFLEEGVADLVGAGSNSFTVGVCSDAGAFEPAGLEFEAVVQYDCLADWDANGARNTLDFVAYQNAWVSQDPETDLNLDGRVNSLDMLVWLNLWNFGCPE
jgi:hypothetical protein